MRSNVLLGILSLAAAGCSKSSPNAPTSSPSPTRFTVFASDRGRAAGNYRNYVTGHDVPGTNIFVIGTTSGIVDKHPSITESGALLVYQSSPGRGGSEDVFGYNTESGQVTDDSNVNTVANETDPYISLDGRRLAFVRDTLGTRHIRLYDTQGQRLIALTRLDGASGTNDWAPALDASGARIVFVSDRLGGPDIFVYTVGSQTLSTFASLSSDSADIEPSISGNGRYVCFASSRAGGLGGYDLVLFDLIAGQLVTLTGNSSAADRDPSISYDGSRIQFASTRSGGLGGMDLWMLDRPGGMVSQVSGQNSSATDVDPVLVWR